MAMSAIEAQKALLVSVMTSGPHSAAAWLGRHEASDFDAGLTTVFNVARSIANEGKQPTLASVLRGLRDIKCEKTAESLSAESVKWRAYAGAKVDLAALSDQVVAAAQEAAMDAVMRRSYSGSPEERWARLSADMQAILRRTQHEWIDGTELARRIFQRAETGQNPDRPKMPTYGMQRFDYLSGGVRPGSLVVVGGRPGSGKSALLAGWVSALLEQDKSVIVYSLEMTAEEYGERMIAATARVDHTRLGPDPHCAMDHDDWRKVSAAFSHLSSSKLLFADGSKRRTVELLTAEVATQHARSPVTAVVVDYTQLVSVTHRSGSREQDVAHVVRTLKNLALEFNVTVIAAAQLNRTSTDRPDKKPTLGDFRESGEIEQACDLAVMTHRPYCHDNGADPQEMELIIAKNRHGDTGMVKCRFEAPQMRITEARKHEGAGPPAYRGGGAQ